MRKNKDSYMNYVCPYCFHTLNKCTCNLFPPYHLILIDRNIQEHIRILNYKGYKTIGCCEGHKTTCLNTYIAFANDFFKGLDMPYGFNYDKKRRIVTISYSTKLTEEEMEECKKDNLDTLLEWCKTLPNRNMER